MLVTHIRPTHETPSIFLFLLTLMFNVLAPLVKAGTAGVSRDVWTRRTPL